MNKTWENHEKYRTDLLKFTGLVFCTPCCGIIFEQLVHGFSPSLGLIVRFLISLSLFLVGSIFIAQSRIVIYNLDEEIFYAKFNNE